MQWKIFWAGLDPVRESEQAGIRPVIIISSEEINTFLPIVAVIPLMSLKPGRKIYSTEVLLLKNQTGLEKDSIALSHQIRIVSKTRLIKQGGVIDSEEIKEKIRCAARLFLDL
ncbi:MAG: type II toxin-antitoxin system PemK/MazF family toxin [Actinobacteria bacterium]|nr:type II toxin-antitoxin system PemK/MazF family toxin [Actinomycetota bacterium]